MPAMAIIEVDPAYKPGTPDDREQLEIAKRMGPREVEYQTALENVQNSRGMYRIKPDTSTRPVDLPPATVPFGRLEDRSNEDLKLMLVQLGVRTEKQMRRSDIIRLINMKLEAVEILPEDDLTPDEDAIAAEAEAARIAERKAAEAGAEKPGETKVVTTTSRKN